MKVSDLRQIINNKLLTDDIGLVVYNGKTNEEFEIVAIDTNSKRFKNLGYIKTLRFHIKADLD